MKKDGGKITKWFLHTLSVSMDVIREQRPDIKTDKPYILTGYVVDDPTGRWQPGWHMRSSLVVEYDATTGRVETGNTIYHVVGESVGDDLGDTVLSIFY